MYANISHAWFLNCGLSGNAVFCKFDDSASAAKAKAVLEKRSFDGKQIGAPAADPLCNNSPSLRGDMLSVACSCVCVGTVCFHIIGNLETMHD